MMKTEIEQFPSGIDNHLDVSDRALLILEGMEGKDLLQRLTTNDVSMLEIGRSSQTILTNEKGRIVEVLSVFMISPDRLLLVGQSTATDRLRGWLDKFIIMEDVKTVYPEPPYRHFILYRSGISQITEGKHGGSTSGDERESLIKALDLPPETILFEEQWGEARIFHLLIDPSHGKAPNLPGRNAGSKQNQFERFRLLHGIPVSPNELSELYNPLEANLGGLVSWTKGCYIGQEVIARLDTYKKIQKHLVRVRMNDHPALLPSKLINKEREAGMLTSAGTLEDGRTVGMAYIGSNTSPGDELHFKHDGRDVVVEQIGAG